MTNYLGDYPLGTVVRFMWNSNAVAGESITRGTNGTISVYKNGNTTQSTAGLVDTEDFDGLTGVHLCTITLSADATFYSFDADFSVVLSAATIDGKTINACLAEFSIGARSPLSSDETALAIWGAQALVYQDAGTFGAAVGDPGVNSKSIYDAVVTDASGASVGVDTTALLAALTTIDDFLDAEIAAILVDTNALNDVALPDSVPADGSIPTLKQAIYEIRQFLMERAVSGTTVTSRKADGTTALETFTLDSATVPTSITRAT